MSQFDKDLKPGDLIRSYHKGFWRVTAVERRFNNQQGLFYEDLPVGAEIHSMILYELVLDSTFRAPSGKRPKHGSCDVGFCEKITPEWVDVQAKKAAEGWARLRGFAGDG